MQATKPLHDCKDGTPPRQPVVQQSIAFERAAKDAVFHPNSPPRPPVQTRRDPLYLEVSGFEPGTRLELINLSANPAADFDTKEKIVLSSDKRSAVNPGGIAMNTTANDVSVGFYIKQSQMEKLGLQAGDQYALRAVDDSGNASATTFSSFEANGWANGRVQEKETFTAGAQINALAGQDARSQFMAKAAADNRDPIIVEENVKFVTQSVTDHQADSAREIFVQRGAIQQSLRRCGFDQNNVSKENLKTIIKDDASLTGPAMEAAKDFSKLFTKFDGIMNANGVTVENDLVTFNDLNYLASLKDNPRVLLQTNNAIEPNATVAVKNMRTGTVQNLQVNAQGDLASPMSNLKDGDTLLITPTDVEGNQGKSLEIRFCKSAKNGRDKPLNIMNVRFQDIP